MATYNQVSYGSKGSDVTELQKLLNQNGYTLDTDGIFGSKTQAAVKDYQQKNSLSVDGIVGENTWGALTKAQTGANSTATPESVDNSFKYDDYAESDIVKQAQAMLQQQMANKPGEYQSSWQDQLNDIINKINNREEFTYDLNGDLLYQQLKDQHTTQGKLAAMDTMGQAAALTGGYGNSYGQAVGQQAYQGHLQQLNDMIPELYNLAMSKHQMEGDDLRTQAALMAQMEDQDYGRYRDQVSDFYTDLDRLYNQYNTERDYDYGKWADGRDFAYGQFSDDRNLAYQTERDKIADQQWQAQFDEAKRQFDKQYALSASKSSGSSNSSGSKGIIARAIEKAEATAKVKDAMATIGFGGEDNGSVVDPATSDNTKLFKSSVMDKNTFAKHGNKATVNGKTYTSYNSYIEAALENWTDNGVPYSNKKLTDDEVSFLMDYYGL